MIFRFVWQILKKKKKKFFSFKAHREAHRKKKKCINRHHEYQTSGSFFNCNWCSCGWEEGLGDDPGWIDSFFHSYSCSWIKKKRSDKTFLVVFWFLLKELTE